MFAQN